MAKVSEFSPAPVENDPADAVADLVKQAGVGGGVFIHFGDSPLGGKLDPVVEGIFECKNCLLQQDSVEFAWFGSFLHSKWFREVPEETAIMMHDEVVARLRHVLTEGEIPPGARIPERELCASFAISRTPLREALKVLAAEGLVVSLPNRGSRAAKLTQNDVKDCLKSARRWRRRPANWRAPASPTSNCAKLPSCRPTWSSIFARRICCRIIAATA